MVKTYTDHVFKERTLSIFQRYGKYKYKASIFFILIFSIISIDLYYIRSILDLDLSTFLCVHTFSVFTGKINNFTYMIKAIYVTKQEHLDIFSFF